VLASVLEPKPCLVVGQWQILRFASGTHCPGVVGTEHFHCCGLWVGLIETRFVAFAVIVAQRVFLSVLLFGRAL